MKPGVTRKKFPADTTEWETAIAAAPGKDRPLKREEEAAMSNALVVKKGGYAAVRAAVASRRKPGQRGPQQTPTKQLVSVRFSPEVLDYFKSTGAGWQTRMNDVLMEWVNRDPTPRSPKGLAFVKDRLRPARVRRSHRAHRLPRTPSSPPDRCVRR
ncbi:MAG TPA: BrnA antitoxin family protein [Burkholderiaceae bacterium]